jgi:hypothetical protein
MPISAIQGLRSNEELKTDLLEFRDGSHTSLNLLSISILSDDPNEDSLPLKIDIKRSETLPAGSYALTSQVVTKDTIIRVEYENRSDEERRFPAVLSVLTFEVDEPTLPKSPPSLESDKSFWDVIQRKTRRLLDGRLFKTFTGMLNKGEEPFNDYFLSGRDDLKVPGVRATLHRILQQGVELISFPIICGSMLANKSLEDLKARLYGREDVLQGDEIIVPGIETMVNPGETCNVMFPTLTRLIPIRFVVHPSLEFKFNLIDIRVGSYSYMPSTIPLSFELVSSMGDRLCLKMDEAGPAKPICLVVKNTTKEKALFSAAFIGRSL